MYIVEIIAYPEDEYETYSVPVCSCSTEVLARETRDKVLETLKRRKMKYLTCSYNKVPEYDEKSFDIKLRNLIKDNFFG